MSFIKICIHSVWGTKDRLPLLTDELRSALCNHIVENAKRHKLFIDTIDGYTDHIHCLFFLNSDMTVEKALQLIKGESSFWINKNFTLSQKFYWADEYFAISVSESMISAVRDYIRNQKEHHRKITFQDEYIKFLAAFKNSHG